MTPSPIGSLRSQCVDYGLHNQIVPLSNYSRPQSRNLRRPVLGGRRLWTPAMRFVHCLAALLWSRILIRMASSNSAKVQEALDEGVNLWVVSSGGVGSSAFNAYIANNFPFHTNRQRHIDWFNDDYLLHAPRPVQLQNPRQLKAVVYIFGNPLHSVCSMKRQKFHVVNLNKLHNFEKKFTFENYSDEELLRAIYFQFKNWTQDGIGWKFGYPVHVLSSEDIFHSECLNVFLPGNHTISLKRLPRSPETLQCANDLRFSFPVFQFVNEMLQFRSNCTQQKMMKDAHTSGSKQIIGPEFQRF